MVDGMMVMDGWFPAKSGRREKRWCPFSHESGTGFRNQLKFSSKTQNQNKATQQTTTGNVGNNVILFEICTWYHGGDFIYKQW